MSVHREQGVLAGIGAGVVFHDASESFPIVRESYRRRRIDCVTASGGYVRTVFLPLILNTRSRGSDAEFHRAAFRGRLAIGLRGDFRRGHQNGERSEIA